MNKTIAALTVLVASCMSEPAFAEPDFRMNEPCPPIRAEWYGPSAGGGRVIKYVDMIACYADFPHQRYMYFQTHDGGFTKYPCSYATDRNKNKMFDLDEIIMDVAAGCDGYNGNEIPLGKYLEIEDD